MQQNKEFIRFETTETVLFCKIAVVHKKILFFIVPKNARQPHEKTCGC